MAEQTLRIGQKIEMTRYLGRAKVNDFGANSYVSKLLEIKDPSKVQIAMPFDGGKLMLLDLGDKYNLYFYTQYGLYHCVAQVDARFRQQQLYIADMVFVSELEKFQRRQYYRLQCLIEMQYKREGVEEEKKFGTSVDISGGGMRFNSTRQLTPGDTLSIDFMLPIAGNFQMFHLRGRVIASTMLINKDLKYENRVEFVEIDEKQREIIVRYIFEEERKRRKRENG